MRDQGLHCLHALQQYSITNVPVKFRTLLIMISIIYFPAHSLIPLYYSVPNYKSRQLLFQLKLVFSIIFNPLVHAHTALGHKRLKCFGLPI